MTDALPEVMELPANGLVVDSDPQDREKSRRLLLEAGVEIVFPVEDGEGAVRAMADKSFGVVIMDWELPGISGLALFNRIKATAGYATTPILITSKLLHRKDFELLREYPCAAHLAKPVSPRGFEPVFFKAMAERSWYAENSGYVDNLLSLMDSDPKQVAKEMQRLVAAAARSPALGLIVARALIDHSYLQGAEALLGRLAKTEARSPAVLWQLARVYYLSGRIPEARRLLASAERFSAANVERLCFQGEVALADRDSTAANERFARCLAVDPGHQRAQAGTILAKNLEGFLKHQTPKTLPRTLAATCNLLGVQLAQSGQVDEGIGQYRAAMAFLGEGSDAHRIAFNLGMAHLRNQELSDALTWFERSEALAKGKFSKAQRYRMETAAAIAGKQPAPEVAQGTAGGDEEDVMEERIGVERTKTTDASLFDDINETLKSA